MAKLSGLQNKQERMRARMIDAGLTLFLQFGFRGVSMEAVAARAEVAKPTLYKYFSDKEALFQAGVARFIAEAKELCAKELQGDREVGLRISRALTAKHKMFLRLVEGSNFAQELYSETARIAAKEFAEFERWLEGEIETTLREAGQDKSVFHAQLIMACALGIANKAQRIEEIGPAIRLVVQKLLA